MSDSRQSHLVPLYCDRDRAVPADFSPNQLDLYESSTGFAVLCLGWYYHRSEALSRQFIGQFIKSGQFIGTGEKRRCKWNAVVEPQAVCRRISCLGVQARVLNATTDTSNAGNAANGQNCWHVPDCISQIRIYTRTTRQPASTAIPRPAIPGAPLTNVISLGVY